MDMEGSMHDAPTSPSQGMYSTNDDGTSNTGTGPSTIYIRASDQINYNVTSYAGSSYNSTFTYGSSYLDYNGTAYTESWQTSSYTYGNNPTGYNGASHIDTEDNITDIHEYDSSQTGYYDTSYTDKLPDYDSESLHYSSYFFEKIIYLYIWEILVIITCLCNIVVISVLLRKKMRSPTYMILVAVAISDSLTGLVTLPTFIPVFHGSVEMPETPVVEFDMEMIANLSEKQKEYLNVDLDGLPTYSSSLSKELCTGFTISKFFLSKSFHTVSVWLTVFLATQRVVSVWSPFKSIAFAMNTKKICIICTVIFLLAPILHIYQLLDDKNSQPGHCEWYIGQGEDCGAGCAYLWIVLFLGHLLPCVFLLIFTVMFAYHLSKSTSSLHRALESSGSMSMSRSTSNTTGFQTLSKIWRRVSTTGFDSISRKSSSAVLNSRQRENRRASIVVIAIVVMFLIPEVPYSAYLMNKVISHHASNLVLTKTNRSLMAAYDILLVLSFNANFYIYTFVNRRFRKVLQETIIKPFVRVCLAICVRSDNLSKGKFWRRASESTSSRSGPNAHTRITQSSSNRDASRNNLDIEMVGLNSRERQKLKDSPVKDESLDTNAVEMEKEKESLLESALEEPQTDKEEPSEKRPFSDSTTECGDEPSSDCLL